MATPEPWPTSPSCARAVRIMFAGLALASLAIGLALYTWSEKLGLDEFTARLLATAFLVTAVADAIILYFWDRLFMRKG
jgi:hypothetical protein